MSNPYAPKRQTAKAPKTAQESTEPQESVEESTEPQGVPDGPAAEVLEWVGEDKDRAQQALEAEEDGQQRVGLTRKLKELAE